MVDTEDSQQQISTDEELSVDEDSFEAQEDDDNTDNTVDELRKLITDWENAQTENAKKALQQ